MVELSYISWKRDEFGYEAYFKNRYLGRVTRVDKGLYIGLYRYELPDGTVSDYVNLSRAKDGLVSYT